MDIKQIKSEYNIVEVINNHLPGGLKRQGSQWVGNCIFHDDTHASLKISDGKKLFKCFVVGCGAGGDVFDFFTLQGKSIKEAANLITNGSIVTPNLTPKIPKVENKWINAVPNQNNLPNPLDLVHYRYTNKPSNFWAYHDNNGNIISYTCRFDLDEGKKDVLPYSFKQQVTPDGIPLGNAIWKWSEIDKPRLMYNIHEIFNRPNDTILVVEGEKTCEAAKLLFPSYVCTTWIGGSDNVVHTDFSPLDNRNVLLWADNDLAGVLAMFGGWSKNDVTGVYKRIKGITDLVKANFQQIKNEQSFPKKWDVADADWSQQEASEYVKLHVSDIPIISEFPPNELPIVTTEKIIAPPPPKESMPEYETPSIYFKPLGFENNDQNLYVFFVYRSNTIVKLTASGISASNLLQLAPLNYWEGHYPKQTRSGGTKFEINTVADDLITKCTKIGIFNPDKIRGRGAWTEKGIPIIHCGDSLIVDGIYTSLSKHKSTYIYEAGQELGFSLVESLSKNEAYKLIQMLERLNWSRSIEARLLAGWIVVAPLCGALNWRPHLWLTGASGTGKSEVIKLFVKRLFGNMFVDAQGSTTEAGVRQYLRADALAVVFDEAESEGKNGIERMQSFLELVRASSTSEGGKIIKGSAGGSASQFNIRSCFAFASILANLTQRSDISRITVLEIEKDQSENRKEKWQETLKIYNETITDEYVKSFQSRSVRMLPTILINAKTFSNAAASELDNQRAGDQLGIILAGAYSLTSDSIISMENAVKFMQERDWSNEKLSDSTRDEIKLINRIMNSDISVETIYGKITRTIGEIVLIARGDLVEQTEANLISETLAKNTLRRIGIKLEGFQIIISDNSEFISRLLTNTPYSKNYHTILSRIDGAVKMEPTTFASGIKSRAIKINTSLIFEGYENPGMTEAEINLHK